MPLLLLEQEDGNKGRLQVLKCSKEVKIRWRRFLVKQSWGLSMNRLFSIPVAQQTKLKKLTFTVYWVLKTVFNVLLRSNMKFRVKRNTLCKVQKKSLYKIDWRLQSVDYVEVRFQLIPYLLRRLTNIIKKRSEVRTELGKIFSVWNLRASYLR